MSNTAVMVENKSEPQTKPHSVVEDGLAMLIATFMISFSMLLMQHAGTLTGGTAGLALLIHYITGIKFGWVFFVLNIPFYYLAYKQLGLGMVIKTFIAVGLLSLLTEVHPLFIQIQSVSPLYLTVLANILMGISFLILFRHRSSLGGINLLALFIQKRYGIAAGKIQMGFDITILLGSLAYISTSLLVISMIGAIILNLILALNHRTDRYVV